MQTIEIPGYRTLEIRHVVCDFNGTIAVDGRLIQGVADLMKKLSDSLDFHVITADTFGSVKKELIGLPCALTVIPTKEQAQSKRSYVLKLGAENVTAVGNGRNDCMMLKAAALSIGLLQEEGISVEALNSADIVCRSIVDALNLLKEPNRLIATLRS